VQHSPLEAAELKYGGHRASGAQLFYALTICKPLLWHKYPAEEDKDMADQEAKTKTIGYLPIEKVQSLKGWNEYLDKSSKLSILWGAPFFLFFLSPRPGGVGPSRHNFCLIFLPPGPPGG
jgi:hypothetical protein